MLLEGFLFLRIDSKMINEAGWELLRTIASCGRDAPLEACCFLQVYRGRCDGCLLAAELPVSRADGSKWDRHG